MKKESATVVPIIAALVVAIAPHTPGLPPWINGWCLFMWGYRLAGLKTFWPMPNTLVRFGLTFIGILGLMLTYRIQIGADAFIGLLALMAAIKPFEMATHRHQMITLLLTYFIIITSLFRSESVFIILYMLFSVFITTMALVRINAPEEDFRESFNLSGIIIAQAIPLMILLFLLFPRLPGSVFGIQDKSLGRTGFSDSLGPGSITHLARDNSPAFRAEFEGALPLPDQLYWRGVLFQEFDGKTWTIGKSLEPAPQPIMPQPKKGKTYQYTIFLEPHNSHWLMALDIIIKGPPWASLTAENTLKSRRPIKQKVQYKAISLVKEERTKETAKPNQFSPKKMAAQIIARAADKNPRARELAQSLAERAETPMEKTRLLLSYFKENSFAYTLDPPTTKGDPIDSFLFETKQGYCEHFASAFSFMMNVMDVPSRVVGGYLGGEHNPYGNYLTIRQSYAHAWVEIFDSEKGWTRVDPTLVVAPERIRTNPDGSYSAPGSYAGSLSFLQTFKFALDAANTNWEAWFTGYSSLEQETFLRWLGLKESKSFAGSALVLSLLIIFFLVLLAVFSPLVFRLFQLRSRHFDPVKKAYGLFCRRLDKLGLTKGPGQGPLDFANACIEKRPDLKGEILNITALYIQLRFQKDCPATALPEFISRIKNFNPPQ
jgi:transglutaminase-like putative cysteine protease